MMKQSINRMLQYGSEFFVKYQFNILSNGFFIYQSFPIRLQSYAFLCQLPNNSHKKCKKPYSRSDEKPARPNPQSLWLSATKATFGIPKQKRWFKLKKINSQFCNSIFNTNFYFYTRKYLFYRRIVLSVKNTKVHIFLTKTFGQFKKTHYLCIRQ